MGERNYTVIVSLGDFVKYTLGEIYYLAPTPIFCGIYCLTNSFETKGQREKRIEELKQKIGGKAE